MIEYRLDSFNELCHNRTIAGEPFERAIINNTIELTTAFNQDPRNTPVTGLAAVISIPRGGVPTAKGVVCALEDVQACSPELITSNLKTDPDHLYPADLFDNLDTLIITDGVTASGKTIISHLSQIPETWSGRLMVLSNACSRLGANAIESWAERHNKSDLDLVTSRIFENDECE